MDNKQFICESVAAHAETIMGVNERVWNFAEVGYQEYKSAAEMVRVLKECGFEVEEGVAGIETAFIGKFGTGKPVIGIMGEFDALPGLSQKAGVAKKEPLPDQPYGHGCGHSALGAGALGAALAVKDWLEKTGTPGTVEMYGCPAEESGFGKTFLARAGCFDHLDMAFSWHPMDNNMPMAVRTVANYEVQFNFTGTTAHAGACPELGRSALDACELMSMGVNYLREHVISDARIHYAYLDCGGDAPNVVQGHASVLYFIRAPKIAQSAEILERIKQIAQGAALMTGTSVQVKMRGGLSDTIPNPTASKLLADCFVEMGGPQFGEKEFEIARRFLDAMPPEQREKALRAGALQNGISPEEFAKRPLHTAVVPFHPAMMQKVMTGSSDVGDVSYIVPTAQITATVGVPGTGPHTWQFAAQVGTSIGGQASLAVSRAIAFACTKVYEAPQLAQTAREELVKETGGVYHCPISDDIMPEDTNVG